MSTCIAIKTNRQPCGKTAMVGDILCRRHRTIEDRRARMRQLNHVWFQVLDTLWTDNPTTIQPLQMIIIRAYAHSEIDYESQEELMEMLVDEWEEYRDMRPVATVPPKSELHALTMDKQNVHTQVVAKQTSTTMDMLLAIPVPRKQDTLKDIEKAWGNRKGEATRVIRDMKAWYKKSECRKTDDWLYRRLLNGLWTRIQIHDQRTELIQRLWEECVDSIDTCCEGHLSRLCSVLVGFDDDANQEASVGERLQHRMSVIAGMDIPVEYKIGEAWSLFEELKIPIEDRTVWIEAL